jgi:hypothetical protein
MATGSSACAVVMTKNAGSASKRSCLLSKQGHRQPPTRLRPDTLVGVRVRWGEPEIPSRVMRAGGTWNPKPQLWELRYDRAVQLGLQVQDRIERGIKRYIDVYAWQVCGKAYICRCLRGESIHGYMLAYGCICPGTRYNLIETMLGA